MDNGVMKGKGGGSENIVTECRASGSVYLGGCRLGLAEEILKMNVCKLSCTQC